MRSNSTIILTAALVAGAVAFANLLREPPAWVLVPAAWMGAPWVQACLTVLSEALRWGWAAAWLMVAVAVIRRVLGDAYRPVDGVSVAWLWAACYFSGPYVVERFLAINAVPAYVYQSTYVMAGVAAVIASIVHTVMANLFDRALRQRSFAVSIPLSVFVLVGTFVNRLFLPGLFTPLSLAVSGGLLVSCGLLGIVLLRVGGVRLDRFSRFPGWMVRYPAVPGIGLAVVVAAAAVIALLGAGRVGGMPNVVLITVDTLRADHLSCYGDSPAATPGLDALAAEGTVFTRCMSTAPMTVPSTLSILSSKFPAYHSVGTVNGHRAMSPAEVTLATVLSARGYRSAAFVGNYLLRRKMGLHRGFDVYDDTFNSLEVTRKHPERTADKTNEYAINWLRTIGDESFFLWVHYQDPHGPYTPPAEYYERAQGPTRPGDPERLPVTGIVGLGGIPKYQYIGGFHSPAEYRRRYIAEVTFTDAMVGELLGELRRMDGWEDAIVVFTADHGEAMGERDFWFCHGYDLTEELLHVPMIARVPGTPAGARMTELTSGVDVMPTILDALGVPLYDGLMGQSLLPLMKGDADVLDRKFIAAEDFHGRVCLQTRELAYIVGPDGERLLRRDFTGSAAAIDDQQLLDYWLVAAEEYKESADPLSGKTLVPTADELRKLKSLGYVD